MFTTVAAPPSPPLQYLYPFNVTLFENGATIKHILSLFLSNYQQTFTLSHTHPFCQTLALFLSLSLSHSFSQQYTHFDIVILYLFRFLSLALTLTY